MESSETLSGLQLAGCIVKRDFQTVCPSDNSGGVYQSRAKKAKKATHVQEQSFYRPFGDDVSAIQRYLEVSPRAVEIIDLLAIDDASTRRVGLALLWSVFHHAHLEETRQHIVDHVLTRLGEQMPDLVTLGDIALHYLLNTVIECIRIAPVDKVRVFLSTFSFYKFFGKNSVPKGDSEAFSVAAFHCYLAEHGVVEDLGISKFAPPSRIVFAEVSDPTKLGCSNYKKQLCILLLLGLKGFNIISKQQVVRQVLTHIKQDDIIDAICTIRLFILVISSFMNAHCARIALSLRDPHWSDVPEPVIISTALAISNVLVRISSEEATDPEHLVRLNGLATRICTEFINELENICDDSTMASVLLKLDATQLTTVEILLPVLQRNATIGPLYMPSFKVSHNGPLEYMTLLKLLTMWFHHASSLKVKADKCMLYIPPMLTPVFFNSGLLSGDQMTTRATLRMLSELLKFLVGSFENEVDRNIPSDIWKRISGVIPDFKTLVNAKTALRTRRNEEGDIMINIKNHTRSMVSSELGLVVTHENKWLILGIDAGVDPLADWLDCLHLYATFVGAGDGKNMYDPCKLLKEDVIARNIDEIASVLTATSYDNDKFLRALKLDMALIECLYCLGIGEVYSGVALTKVQSVCFEYILKRYVELKLAFTRHSWDLASVKDYLDRCQRYLVLVVNKTGLFSEDTAQWFLVMNDYNDFHIFQHLFHQCLENPLEALLGSLSSKAMPEALISYKCTSCMFIPEFKGPLFLRMVFEFLLHLSKDYEKDLHCEECNIRQVNLVKGFMKRSVDALDPVSAAKYIIQVCHSIRLGPSAITAKRIMQMVIDKHEIKMEPLDMGINVNARKETPAVDSPAVQVELAHQCKPNDNYLVACKALIESIQGYNQDVCRIKRLCSAIVSTLDIKVASGNIIEKGYPTQNIPQWTTFVTLEDTVLYTYLFYMITKIMDIGSVPADLSYLFQDLSFEDELRWAQLYYLKLRLFNAKDTGAEERLVKILHRVCTGSGIEPASRIPLVITMAIVSTVIPEEVLHNDAAMLLEQVLDCIHLPLECTNCKDLFSCNLGYSNGMLMIGIQLAKMLPESQNVFVAKLIQSPRILEISQSICESNSYRYFHGDTIESSLLLSHLRLLQSLLLHIDTSKLTPLALNQVELYRLLNAVAGVYRCSYTECDQVLKDLIIRIVTVLGHLANDTRSIYLRLPPFKDFACISEPSWTVNNRAPKSNGTPSTGCTCKAPCNHDIVSHGITRGWPTMTQGFSMISSNSNWLCLDSKRVLATCLSFPSWEKNKKEGLHSICRKIAILYPSSSQSSIHRNDTIFNTLTRLKKFLGNNSNILEKVFLGDPYVYDVSYLIPFFVSRLCSMLHDQLYQYKHELEDRFKILKEMVIDPSEVAANRFSRTVSTADARCAGERLYSQLEGLNFDISMGEVFSPVFMEQIVNNGVLEICILGLLSKCCRKDAIKALSLIIKLVYNMIDAAIVRSVIPERPGPYKLRRIGLFGIQQVHSLLCFLQRCKYYANDGDPALLMVLASNMVRHITNPEDRLYQLGNRFFIAKYQPKMDEVPLFFECFNVQGAADRVHFLTFILQVILSSAHLLADNNVFIRRRVIQQLMSFAFVDTTRFEHRVQIAEFLYRNVEVNPTVVYELYASGIAPWISAMSTWLTGINFSEAKMVVFSTMLLSSLTQLIRSLGRAICTPFKENVIENDSRQASKGVDNDQELVKNDSGTSATDENVREIVTTVEALKRIAEGWSHILSYIPKDKVGCLQIEGYMEYYLIMEEVMANIRYRFANESGVSNHRVNKLSLVTMEMANDALRKFRLNISETN
ncbi:hypothetical protein BBOV_II006590 [Babesia bovis T2Bo]|uniref:URB1 C-terminal domain-containing protein n=1 Tax=Babesia bovis TaxID=5865 RepID=A7AUJ8_BABBO|nr:hypothetical protein BBOV_II006590 [Babesia bovis T2Bo]EDO06609.1 hypothetical protein BBOV_II006590 [Babesia bovis T2Bo]|eukprot:XP_001610177.1 hypothetical protein [Babesia bovis T2Bo]